MKRLELLLEEGGVGLYDFGKNAAQAGEKLRPSAGFDAEIIQKALQGVSAGPVVAHPLEERCDGNDGFPSGGSRGGGGWSPEKAISRAFSI